MEHEELDAGIGEGELVLDDELVVQVVEGDEKVVALLVEMGLAEEDVGAEEDSVVGSPAAVGDVILDGVDA